MKRLYKIISIGAITFIAFIIMESSMRNGSFFETMQFVFSHKKISLVSLTWLFILNVLFVLIANNIFYGSFLIIFLSISLSLGNFQKIYFRGEPLFLYDLENILNIKDLLKMLEFKDLILILSIVIFVIVFLFLFIKNRKQLIKKFNVVINRSKKLLLIIISMLAVFYSFRINYVGNKVNELYMIAGYRGYNWDPLMTYRENGFVASFLHNFPAEIMAKPKEYNLNRMAELKEKYEIRSLEINEGRLKEDFSDLNVVYILSESLSDPSRFDEIKLSENIMPYISNTDDKLVSGNLIVPSFGGGTANVEYELLTSFSTKLLAPTVKVPYQNFVTNLNKPYSIVQEMNHSNLSTIAAHSYHSKFYKRRKVFDVLGFESQYFMDDMNYDSSYYNNNYVSDEDSYREIMRYIRETDGSFVHFITMQNHTPYNYSEKFDSSMIIDVPESINKEEFTAYVNQVRDTDKATEQFISEVNELDKDTIVLLYGDHHPPLYSSILNSQNKIEKYSTDFFIYSNFDRDLMEEDITISVNNINQLIYKVADVKVDLFQAFMVDFSSEITAFIDNDFLIDDEIKTYEELTDYQKELLEEYELIQYDILVGKKHFIQ